MKPFLYAALAWPLVLLLSAQPLLSQNSPGFSYQAVARDTDGLWISNGTVNLGFEFFQGTPGAAVSVWDTAYTNVPTNQFGLFSLTIGKDNPGFDQIDWSSESHFVVVALNGAPVDTMEMATVPYSSISRKAIDMTLSELQDVSDFVPNSGQVLRWNGNEWEPSNDPPDADSDPTNELQSLNLSGNTLSLSNGGNAVSLSNFVSPWSSSGSNVYYNGGDVGIGTSSPGPRLDVRGDIDLRSWLRGRTSGGSLRYFQTIASGSGYMETLGPNGNRNIWITYVAGAADRAYFGICDVNGNAQAGMYVDGNGNGVVFKDIDNFRMDHPLDPEKEIWYAAMEGPEAGAYERGTATLQNGETFVPFSEHFELVVNPSTMTITLTPLDASSEGMAVIEKTAQGFRVKELHNGTGNYSFDWEVKGVRAGFEDYRVIRDKSENLPGEVNHNQR